MIREDQKIASEMNDLFMKLTEMLWEHLSESSIPTESSSSFNITEHFLIEFLGKENFASMSKLSKIFHVAPTTMTSIVDRLIQRGYLERHSAQQDRRKILIHLSEKGKHTYNYHHYESLEIYSRYLNELPDRGKKFRKSLNEIRKKLVELREYLRDI